MTDLRDARLRQALDEAPDARLQPHARTREAIHAAAHAAVQPVWKRWWQATGRGSVPWAAGFATFVVATLVTVLWHDEEVPDARPASDAVAVAPSAPAPQEAPAPPVPQPAPVPAPAVVPAPAPAPPVAAQARARAAAAEKREAERLRERQQATARRSAPERPAAEAAMADAARPAGPVPREQRSAGVAPDVASEVAPPAAPAAAPAPPPAAAAPAPPSAAAAAPAPLRAERAPPPAVFTQVRVEGRGRSVVLPADQAGLLPALVVRLLASPVVATGAVSGTASLRLELAHGNDAFGVLERLGEHWRWAPVDPAQPVRLLRPPASLDADLREEAARLLR